MNLCYLTKGLGKGNAKFQVVAAWHSFPKPNPQSEDNMLINILLVVWNAYLCYMLYTITNNIETIHKIIEILNSI